MACRPELTKGYLGPQSKFEEFGLSTFSHTTPEINLEDNKIEIKLRFSKPVKVTANLINCAKTEELPQYVFTQMSADVISFLAVMPETGWYKLQIYALPLPDDCKTLPGVYNYLINCKRVASPCNPFPKQFAQWKEGCYIVEPVVLHSGCDLSHVKFEATIPNAKTVAVVAEGEWTHLNQRGDGMWEGTLNLEQYRGRDAKVTLNANYGGEEAKYSTLLEYRI